MNIFGIGWSSQRAFSCCLQAQIIVVAGCDCRGAADDAVSTKAGIASRKAPRTIREGFAFTNFRYGLIPVSLLAISCALTAASLASEPGSLTFSGEKTLWHGFDRYDFLLDEQKLTIQPTRTEPDEGDGIKHRVGGQRRCIVVVPKVAAPGNP